MGMFDWVNYECICEVCDSKITEFQSKSGYCVLDMVSPLDVEEFYGYCDKCGCRVNIKKDGENFIKTTSNFTDGKISVILDVKKIKIKK